MTDDTMVERAEALLRLFDQHQVVHAKRDSEGFSVCSCGWTALGISSDPPALNHRRDVTATALLPLVREAQAGAWQEGNLAASECFTRLIGWATVADPKREDAPDMPTNPYRTGDDHARVTPSETPSDAEQISPVLPRAGTNQRTFTATAAPGAGEVERVAIAIALSDDLEWQDVGSLDRETYLANARAAITALRDGGAATELGDRQTPSLS